MELGIRLSDQLLIFVYAVLFGMLLGALFEVFRLMRALMQSGAIMTALQDLLYWIVAGFAVYSFFLVFTEGIPRVYVLFGTGAGMLLYFGTVGKLFALLYRALRRLRRGKRLRRTHARKVEKN